MFSSFGVKPPDSGFHLILRVASRLLHPHSTDGNTSRLMVRQFSTARDTDRFTELHGEEKREEVDRGDQEGKRESEKGSDQSSQ